MPRKGENIYKRKDGRWEGRYIKSYNDYAIAKSDMLIKGGNASGMMYGDTLSQDKFSGYEFDYIISNEAVICGLTPEKARNIKEFAA